MAKGDDAILKKKNKVNRKRLRNSESAVSARIAAVIASKRRRKAGKRRISEGMCFSLPTPEDPFNDRHNNKNLSHLSLKKDKDKNQKQQQNIPKSNPRNNQKPPPKSRNDRKLQEEEEDDLNRNLSKFVMMCLSEIVNSWEVGEREDVDIRRMELFGNPWGIEIWQRCCRGWNVVDTSGDCATKEQLAWVLSTASDLITRMERCRKVLNGPLLLYIVSSQEKAHKVRSMCKPLKELGVHTVSLHPGALVDHQIRGLKHCEPEFLISTPDRLLELVHQKAIDISGVPLLVLDGLKSLVDSGFSDMVKSIKESISGQSRMVTFGNCYEETSKILLRSLLKGPVSRLSLDNSMASRSALISQHVHVYTSEDEKLLKTLQILTEAFPDQKLLQDRKVLLVAENTRNAQMLASKLVAEGYAMLDDSLISALPTANGKKTKTVTLKDLESVEGIDVAEFEVAIFLKLPSIENYIGFLKKTARYSITGAVHCFFSTEDAPLAAPLINVLVQCGQTVPKSLRDF